MRVIKYIVLHCTAGPANQSTAEIQNYWKKSLGWKSPGYHHLINVDGTIDNLLPIELPSNGVAGYNSNSIHISYKGGQNGIDTRAVAQIDAQIALIKKYKTMFPKAEIKGHRDFPNVKKLCPSFDVKTWLKFVNLS
jgi:N-acetylmuramoyl-L-alanine amidase